jgi:membrane protease YdiL (CAAX protease family)
LVLSQAGKQYRSPARDHGLDADCYAIAYFGSIFLLPILGASVMYWLVQFLIPIAIMRVMKEPLSGINFKWSAVFADFKIVILTVLVIVPALLFMVRDSEQILLLFQSWRIAVYLPLSILFMLIVAAVWEEFFFRGIVMSSVLKLTSSPVAAIFSSALLFGTYHVPMRFLNQRSPYHDDLLASIAATVNEQFLMGLLMGIIVYKSKNVWHAIWIHSVLNGVSYVYQLSLILKL